MDAKNPGKWQAKDQKRNGIMAAKESNNETGGKRLSALGDLIFHKTFSSPENVDILAGLARDIFGVETKSITILDPYDIKVYMEQRKESNFSENRLRHTRKDIKARFETADFTAELQVGKDDFFVPRSLKYAFDTFTENYNEALREGVARKDEDTLLFEEEEAAILSRYASLRPVYALNIVNFNLFHDEAPLRVFSLYDPKRGKSLDREWLHVGYFEISKPGAETERQGWWRDYFLGNPLPERAPVYIRKAAKLLDYVNLTREERRMFDRDEYAQSAYESELYTARRIGRDEGLAAGKAEECRANAARMKADGMDSILIAKYTGLSLKEIRGL